MKKEIMKFGLFSAMLIFAYACGTTKESLVISDEEKALFNYIQNDTVTIADEESEYEITIIDPGFNQWLQTIAKREGYYSQEFLESRNDILTLNWNLRVSQPFNFNPELYWFQIDYDPEIDYGYDVNYKLYYYFVYFQRRYGERLGPWLPRI